MPGYVIHLAVANRYLEKHKIDNAEEFIKGVISPDLQKGTNSNSHYGEFSSKPDLTRYLLERGISSSYDKGYFLHLVTDKLFFEKVIDANSLKDKTIEDLYRDYDITNRELIEKYNIIIPKEIENVIGFEEGELACFSMNKLCSFIEKLSSINMEQLETSIKKGIDMETEIPIVVIASNNKDKINEIQELLPEYKVISQSESGIDIEVEEDASTFEGNAIKKAETIAKLLDGKLCIADDSGVCVEYLNGEPGVHTKRFLEGTDRDRNIAILEKLRGVSKEKRKATNSTAIAISNGKDTKVIIETLEGYIAEDLRGENGFGFDEIFELEDGRTVAELSKAEQLELKPRGKAVKRITNVLGKKKEIEER